MLPEALAALAASVSAALVAATDACSPREQGSLGFASGTGSHDHPTPSRVRPIMKAAPGDEHNEYVRQP
jgi:hypothetical protein